MNKSSFYLFFSLSLLSLVFLGFAEIASADSSIQYIGSFSGDEIGSYDFASGGHGFVENKGYFYFFPAASYGKYQDNEYQFGAVLLPLEEDLAVLDTFELPKLATGIQYQVLEGAIYGFGGTPVQGRSILPSSSIYSLQENLYRSGPTETIVDFWGRTFERDGAIQRLSRHVTAQMYVGSREAGLDTFDETNGWKTQKIPSSFHMLPLQRALSHPQNENIIYLFNYRYGAHYKIDLETEKVDILETFLPSGMVIDTKNYWADSDYLYFYASDSDYGLRNKVVRFSLETERFYDYLEINIEINGEDHFDIWKNYFLVKDDDLFRVYQYQFLEDDWSASSKILHNSKTDSLITIAASYQRLLGRNPDQGGLMYWSNLINSEELSLLEMEDIIKKSDEYNNFMMKNQVRDLYYDILDRVPDYGGFYYWLAEYSKGMPIEEIKQHFLNSNEKKNG